MKNRKVKIAVIAILIMMILAIAPAFLIGSLKTRSMTMTVGDNGQIELTNPVLQMLAKYEVTEGNAIAVEKGGRVEAYNPGETEVDINVPFRTMTCKVYVLGFENDEETMLTGQTIEPQIAGASEEAEFYSSDESVVKVENGKLVTLSDGDATIVCSDKGLEVTQTVHVAGIISDREYLFAGNKMQLTTNAEISGTPTEWTTKDPDVASIDENGVITGVNAGTAVVTCKTADNKTLETKVNIVGMKDPDLFLKSGEQYESPLTSGEGFDAVGIEWKSENRDVLRVDESGNIKAVNGGETQVTCSIDGQEMKNDVHVMTMPEEAFTAVGMDSALSVAYAGDNEVKWTSSDESKVKVEDGVLKGVGTGSATVTATVKDRTFSSEVSVVKLSDSSLNMEEKNDTETLKVTGAKDQEVTWESKDESIATVDENGEITPVSAGSTVVYCNIGPSTMSIPVTVEPEEAEEPKENADTENTADEADKTDKTKEEKETASDTAQTQTDSVSNKADTENKASDSAERKSDSKEKKADSADKKADSSDKKTSTSKKSNTDKKASTLSSTDKKTSSSEKKTSTDKKTSSSTPKTPTKVTNNNGVLTGPEAMVACGNYYNSVLEKAVKKGEKWVYSNSSKYVAQSGTFEKMLAGKIRGGNCASIANWAFRDMGLISNSEKFYGDGSGKIRNYNSGSTKLKAKLDKNCEIINGKQKSFGTLMKEGKIEVGDVIIGKGHTYVYRGNGTVFASGHDAKWHKDKSVKTEDSNKAVFESWIRSYKGTYDEKFKVHYIIRIKDSFVPKYYRDENGNLVKNQ